MIQANSFARMMPDRCQDMHVVCCDDDHRTGFVRVLLLRSPPRGWHACPALLFRNCAVWFRQSSRASGSLAVRRNKGEETVKELASQKRLQFEVLGNNAQTPYDPRFG